MHEGDARVLRAVVGWTRRGRPPTRRPTARLAGRHITGSTGSSAGSFPDHPWRSHLQRSALTLKGLTYAPTGAIVAAATTSLPETPGGERNWDYRYTWIRDSTFALWGAVHARVRLGGQRLLLLRRRHRGATRTACRSCTASAGSAAARAGAGTSGRIRRRAPGSDRQRRVLAAPARRLGRGTGRRRTCTRVAGPPRRTALADPRAARSRRRSTHWREPDRGIWEVRGEPKHFTSSKVMCWVALDRGARLARLRGRSGPGRALAGGCRGDPADVCEHALDARGVFTQHYGHDGAGRLGAADAAGADSCRPTTSGSAAPCWRSPTS